MQVQRLPLDNSNVIDHRLQGLQKIMGLFGISPPQYIPMMAPEPPGGFPTPTYNLPSVPLSPSVGMQPTVPAGAYRREQSRYPSYDPLTEETGGYNPFIFSGI